MQETQGTSHVCSWHEASVDSSNSNSTETLRCSPVKLIKIKKKAQTKLLHYSHVLWTWICCDSCKTYQWRCGTSFFDSYYFSISDQTFISKGRQTVFAVHVFWTLLFLFLWNSVTWRSRQVFYCLKPFQQYENGSNSLNSNGCSF